MAIWMIASLLAARNLGPTAFGVLAAANGVYLLFSSLALLGLDQLYLSSRISLGTLKSKTPTFAVVPLASAVSAFALIPGLDLSVRLAGCLLAIAGYVEFLRWPWLLAPQFNGDYSRRARRELGSRFAAAVAWGGTSFFTGSPLLVAVAILAVSCLLTVAVLPTMSRAVDVNAARAAEESSIALIRRGAGFVASSVLFTVYAGFGLTAVAILLPTEEAAILRASSVVVTATLLVPIALNGEVLRVAVYRLRNDPAAASALPLVLRYAGLNGILGVAAGIVTWWLAPDLLVTLLGPGYEGVRSVCRALALVIPLSFLTIFASNALIALGHLRWVLIAQAFSALVAVVAGTLLVAELGVLGAPYALLLAELAGLVIYAGRVMHLRRNML